VTATNAQRLALALEHQADAEALERAKAREAKSRAAVVAACFPSGVTVGMNRCPLDGGAVVKAEVRPSVRFERGELEVGLQLMRDHGSLGAELAGRLVVHKPEVRVGELKKLPEPFAGMMQPIIDVQPGSVSVELKKPER
jgi:hypothetical protein